MEETGHSMPPEDEGKGTESQLFGSYADAREDNEQSSRGWIVAAVFLVAAIAVAWFFLPSNPYDDRVSHMRAGMPLRDVCSDLGFAGQCELPEGAVGANVSRSDNGGPEYVLHIDRDPRTVSYQKPGIDQPLVLKFDSSSRLTQWCFKDKCHAFE
jgi:hypothetical protein